MKKVAVWLIFGWFFSIQTPHQTRGVIVTTTVGAFQSEAACKIELDALKDLLGGVGIPYRTTGCQYIQES